MAARDLEYIAPSRGFAVSIPYEEWERMVNIARAWQPLETGGVLVGRYSRDKRWAQVARVYGPGQQSTHGRLYFERAARALNRLLAHLWRRFGGNRYYLGEWHSHPSASAQPSISDQQTMFKIARRTEAHCPEPLLVIVGGNLTIEPSLSVTVFTRDGERISLVERSNY